MPLPRRLITIRNEGGLFKVQISGFADTSEVREFIPLLQKYGFTDILVIHQDETELVPVAPAVIPPAAPEPGCPKRPNLR
ncbi:MAG: hypothetical protein MZV63_71875 [Marinilabiliales bacterium]|nr:hypothetical protein [Marinilabiliales bacterium]